MNLFISKFKCEARPLAAIAVMLLTCELSLRAVRPKLSLDIVSIRGIPLIAETLSRSRKPRMLFLGNSLARESIDLGIVRKAIERDRFSVACDKVPSLTGITPSSALPGRQTSGLPGAGVCIEPLSDTSEVHPEGIAAYFGGWQAAGAVFAR
jgi:hypothetical protein